MSDCIDIPDLPLFPFPDGLSIPTLPTISFGDIEACCIILVPKIELKIPLALPSAIQIGLAALVDKQIKLLEAYYAYRDLLPTCPME